MAPACGEVMMRSRKHHIANLAPDEGRPQGQITHSAFLHLGRERGIALPNEENVRLGGQPLTLATASEAGCANIEAELTPITLGWARRVPCG
jgi:hypothetical protein